MASETSSPTKRLSALGVQGRVALTGTVDPDWFLEMRIALSDLEGEAIHGMLISDRAEQEDSN